MLKMEPESSTFLVQAMLALEETEAGEWQKTKPNPPN